MTAFAVQNKQTGKFRGVVAQGGSKERRAALGGWREAVRDSVFAALGVAELEVAHFVDVPLAVEITFRLARPASHYGTGRNAGKLKPSAPPFPMGTPDVDKLARAVLDALKGSAFDDDSRVVDLHPRKIFAERGESEGATIRVRAAGHVAPVLVLVPSTVRPQGGPGTLGELLGLATGRLEATTLYPPSRPQAREPDEGTELADERNLERRQERIRRATQGTLFDAEARVEAELRRSHAVAKHTPPHVDDEFADHVCSRDATEPCAGCAELGAPVAVPVLTRTGIVEVEGPARDPFGDPYPSPIPTTIDEGLDSVIARGDRGELARRFLEVDARSPDHAKILAALANKPPPPLEDDFGGPDL